MKIAGGTAVVGDTADRNGVDGDSAVDDPTAADAAIGRPVLSVVLLATALAVGALFLAIGLDQPTAAAWPGQWWIALFIAAGFALAERFVFHIEYRRDAISFSMSEGATALALAFLSPVAAIVIRVVVSVVVICATSRPPLYKLYFNATLFAFEMTLAFAIVREIAGVGELDGTRFLVGVAIGLVIASLVNSTLVSVAISFFAGQSVGRVINGTRTSIVLSPIHAMVATITVAPALFRLEFVLFAVVPVAATWMIFQQHGQLAQHHRDLEALHGFAGVVGHSLDVDVVANTAVVEAMRLLRAERGVLHVYGPRGEVLATSSRGAPIDVLPTDRHDPRWADVFAADRPTTCDVDGDGVARPNSLHRRSMLAAPIRDDDGDLGLLVLADRAGATNAFDAAELSRAQTLAEQLAASLRKALLHARMEHAALHDALTGDLNRQAFEQLVDEELAVPQQTGCAAVLMLDLNRFKEVNDTLGHHVGDRVLVEFAGRVRRQLRAGDVLARFGGDEFAVLVHRADVPAVRAMADELVADSFTPLRLDDLDVVVAASVGIAVIDGDAGTSSEVLRQADVAMYTAKREHIAVETYRNEIDRRTPERLSLLGGLREVLENGGLEVHYQPKLDLVSSTVTGAEALVRWHHPSRGWVSPADFVQVAEESGLIKQLTDQVLTAAIRTASGWFEAGYDLGVAVNLSTHDLLDEQLPHRIGRLLASHDMPAERLTLEITESSLLADTPRTMSTIDRLAGLGVRLSLDDFGTGYSSLGYLRRLPVAELKVDQSFVKNLLLDEQDGVIVRSTIDLGHNLGLQIVAEGIENTPILDRLVDLGCDIGQGYGISRPLSPEMFGTWLRTTEYAIARRVTTAWA